MAERKGDDFAPEEGWHLQENWAGIFTDRTGHMATHVSGTHGKGNPFWTRAASQLFFFKARLPLAQTAIHRIRVGQCRCLVAGHTCVCCRKENEDNRVCSILPRARAD